MPITSSSGSAAPSSPPRSGRHGRGNRAGALRAYNKLRRRPRDELGIPPSAKTQTLYRTLLD